MGSPKGWAARALVRLRQRTATLQSWPRRRKGAVTAMMLGERCLAVRLATGGQDGRLRLQAASSGGPEALASWRSLAKGSTPLLVLSSTERNIQLLDKPQVLDDELAMAVRWPAAAAQDVDPDQLLCTALALPMTSSSARPQVLAISSLLDTAQKHLQALRAQRIDVRHIDIIDSSLLGMLRLQSIAQEACVSIASTGSNLCIGLMWQGQFCALRTVALPSGHSRHSDDYRDALSLHIQRSVDSFERQATLLSIKHVVLNLPGMSFAGREAVAAALPIESRIFDLEHWVDIDPSLAPLLRGQEELSALACVAAARLLEPAAQAAAADEVAGADADAAPQGPMDTPGAANGPRGPVGDTRQEPRLDLPPLQLPTADAGTAKPGAPGTGKPADEWMLQP